MGIFLRAAPFITAFGLWSCASGSNWLAGNESSAAESKSSHTALAESSPLQSQDDELAGPTDDRDEVVAVQISTLIHAHHTVVKKEEFFELKGTEVASGRPFSIGGLTVDESRRCIALARRLNLAPASGSPAKLILGVQAKGVHDKKAARLDSAKLEFCNLLRIDS